MSGIIVFHGDTPIAMSQTTDISSIVGNDIIHINDYALRIVPRKSTLLRIHVHSLKELLDINADYTPKYHTLIKEGKIEKGSPFDAIRNINDMSWCELKLYDAGTDTFTVMHHAPKYTIEVTLNKQQMNITDMNELKKEVPVRQTESTTKDIKSKSKTVNWNDIVEEDETKTIMFNLPDDSNPDDDYWPHRSLKVRMSDEYIARHADEENNSFFNPVSPFTAIMNKMHSTPTQGQSPQTPTVVPNAVIEFEGLVMESIKTRMLNESPSSVMVAGQGMYIKMFSMDEKGNISIITRNFSKEKLKLVIIETPKSVDPAEGNRTVIVTSKPVSNGIKLRKLERGMFLRAGDIDLKMAPCANLAEATSECTKFVRAFCKAYNSVVNSNLAIKFPSELD
ncbi:VP9 [Micromonas pusilla reovirus]|uniref:Putative outer capsid protein VP9 n=1 Tax=Micromonas pusilla reovirus (isolate Netherlands/2005) TaxID=649596 RepID=VP9_MPRVN|nr:VP9 [Micromonas pusilla reovirus]Q1I0U3.1 RecName: Full=Putative outer capsid protein VP9 [Micromonas pusilla reovirus (isolate Netherlands)]AAZ94049.1 VP9 [Micromonas pusilla reovirus]